MKVKHKKDAKKIRIVEHNKWVLLAIAILVVILIIVIVMIRDRMDNGGGDSLIIGGDEDENGCLISAGYLWCESKNKCLRQWEEFCPELSTLEDYYKTIDLFAE